MINKINRTIARLYHVAEQNLKRNGVAKLGNLQINYLLPSSMNDDKHNKKQVTITIDYENCDE